jgi:hypothetical protein
MAEINNTTEVCTSVETETTPSPSETSEVSETMETEKADPVADSLETNSVVESIIPLNPTTTEVRPEVVSSSCEDSTREDVRHLQEFLETFRVEVRGELDKLRNDVQLLLPKPKETKKKTTVVAKRGKKAEEKAPKASKKTVKHRVVLEEPKRKLVLNRSKKAAMSDDEEDDRYTPTTSYSGYPYGYSMPVSSRLKIPRPMSSVRF